MSMFVLVFYVCVKIQNDKVEWRIRIYLDYNIHLNLDYSLSSTTNIQL